MAIYLKHHKAATSFDTKKQEKCCQIWSIGTAWWQTKLLGLENSLYHYTSYNAPFFQSFVFIPSPISKCNFSATLLVHWLGLGVQRRYVPCYIRLDPSNFYRHHQYSLTFFLQQLLTCSVQTCPRFWICLSKTTFPPVKVSFVECLELLIYTPIITLTTSNCLPGDNLHTGISALPSSSPDHENKPLYSQRNRMERKVII